ncbi:phosphotransferase [Kitasatospora acidiphila]|uniref:Phosphotransferase n=1 Tax=Kitasatospora acidiphila TaxID=2567942 RepID=A0A540W5W5_9ACTN|nr:phosphotransferase [Kitasatospora acidiphila]TQF04390.1 phosphotransferase [Kitasatospora acidiphila]
MYLDGRVPSGAREITTGQANRVWYVDQPAPYVLKHYGDPARAANEAAALRLLAAHHIPAPRLLATAPDDHPGWTAQTAVHPDPIPAEHLLDELAEPLVAIHQISGTHFGRLAGARRYPTWPSYLHDRLAHYTSAAPHLAPEAAKLHDQLDALAPNPEPRLLHHDLQLGHLVRQPDGTRLLLDWELAAFGDPLSDLARLAVRLRHIDTATVAGQAASQGPGAEDRLDLYWRIHRLADRALALGSRPQFRGRS